jgi:hypothetical protein
MLSRKTPLVAVRGRRPLILSTLRRQLMRKGTIRRSAAILAATGALALGAVATAQPGSADNEGWTLTTSDAFPYPVSNALTWDAMSNACRAQFSRWQDRNFQAHYYNGGHVCTYVAGTPGASVDYGRACASFNIPPMPASGGAPVQYQYRGWRYDLNAETNVVCNWGSATPV